MFCPKKIELHTVNAQLPSALIPREMLVDFTQARELIEHAQAQAQSLIQQAQAQCERVLEEAGQHFWQRATPLLQRWESERQAMHEGLEQVATSVINRTIRSLLDETPPPQRVRALLNQLLAAQLPPVNATLLCHPQDREAVEQWLARLIDVPWTLRVANEVSTQSLLLETQDGGFHINWVDALDHLIAPK
ncbi:MULTISPECIES: type III secretion system stator protein SctL [Pseudomonas]|jgi:type III secretion protein L|uniref:Type III secretion system stator protein SctL n=1 Tax=Pseudomonas azadiae TaxID=2843612 RepID=A0ABS6NT43_9PSED|nr:MULTISPECIES: type III secretion system stator protein SctL [Pseudomonas]MBV4451350.1 type III secretion system stator protein SctL [Pseudomonas azadiae]NMF42360.1 type III secretion system stator protein SctL [Pseudomonas sp. SWRI 103]